jgi:transcriptional regulator
MLSTRHDAPVSEAEWKDFLITQDFGQLIAVGRHREEPLVIPTHYNYDGGTILELHLHRANPVWPALTENPRAVFAVVDAHVYVPTDWNADAGMDPAWSAPTSYYAAVQTVGTVSILEDPGEIAMLLRRQMRRMQPAGGYGPIEPGPSPYGRMLRGIRGLRLEIEEVRTKFKFGGNKTAAHQAEIARRLAERGHEADLRARDHLLRRRQQLQDHGTAAT